MPSKHPVKGKPIPGKRYFTTAQATAMLPLVRSIVRDITELARDLREREERVAHIRPPERGSLLEAYEEEMRPMKAEIERDQERMREYAVELAGLGIELKDPHMGLVDFPCWMGGREVYLCWRLGEQTIGFWHELDGGFSGRQKLPEADSN